MLNGIGDTAGSAAEKVGGTAGNVAKQAKVPALVGTAAAAGLAGGVALGARMLGGRKTRSRVPMPHMNGGALKSMTNEVQHVGREIGKAGLRVGIGDVSMEVQKGERSKDTRDSPLEVLLNGLTSRRSRR